MLVRAYEDDDVVEEFRPDTRLAVTIPTVDPQRGRLTGIVVQLPTLVRDEAGNEFRFRTPSGRSRRSGPRDPLSLGL